MFQKGDKVRLKTTIPMGEIVKMRMDEEGIVWYLMAWTNEGMEQERWFTAGELETTE